MPVSCAELGFSCGSADDGCGGVLECGQCAPNEACGVRTPNVCDCAPKSCEALAFECSITDDGCGGILDCGTCEVPSTCGGGGVPGRCGCEALTCEDFDPASCGALPDGCGQMLECGTCGEGSICGGDGRPRTCAPPLDPRLCHEGGWCWLSLTPMGLAFTDVTALPSGDAWAVGEAGVISYFNGESWFTRESPVRVTLRAVWAADLDAVWAVGDEGKVVHFDGSRWSEVNLGAHYGLTDVVGRSRTDVWATGPEGTFHFDGVRWRWVDVPGFDRPRALSVSLTGELFAVGAHGTLFQWDGSNWKRRTSWTDASLSDVFVASDSAMWLATDTSADGKLSLRYLYGTAWTWVQHGPNEPLRQLGGTAADDLWALAKSGLRLWHWNGEAWRSWTITGRPLTAITPRGVGEVWIVGEQGRVEAWKAEAAPAGDSEALRVLWDVHGSDANDVWAVGSEGRAHHWNGSSWTAHPLSTAAHIVSVWSGGPGAAFIVTDDGEVHRWNGSSWTREPVPVSVANAVWGTPDGQQIWVVGDGGETALGENGVWTSVPSPSTQKLLSVWGSAANDIWAGGASGTILRWDGTSWQSYGVLPFTDLIDLHGTSNTDVWATNSTSKIHHWDGIFWSQLTLPPDVHPTSVRALGPDHLVIAGVFNTWEWKNGQVRPLTPTQIPDLALALEVIDGDVWAAGSRGVLRVALPAP